MFSGWTRNTRRARTVRTEGSHRRTGDIRPPRRTRTTGTPFKPTSLSHTSLSLSLTSLSLIIISLSLSLKIFYIILNKMSYFWLILYMWKIESFIKYDKTLAYSKFLTLSCSSKNIWYIKVMCILFCECDNFFF